jgi:hypothetical protein
MLRTVTVGNVIRWAAMFALRRLKFSLIAIVYALNDKLPVAAIATFLQWAVVCLAASLCAAGQGHFRLATPQSVENRLKSFSTKNRDREVLISKWLAEAGCDDSHLREQSLERRLPPNVICVMPGKTQEVILVCAHTDHIDEFGDGVVDNWTGAALLPNLLYSLNTQPRRHTFIFVGFSAEEKGLVGSEYYVLHLSNEERSHIAAVLNMDSLGMAPTKVWASHSDERLLDMLASVSAASKLPVAAMNVDRLGSADSESFAKYGVPRITLHSLTQENWRILHSSRDKLNAVNLKDYYDSYCLIAVYLAYLDERLPSLASATKDKK